MRILLIEDNKDDVALITELLARAKGEMFSVEPFERLSTGLERLARGGIDVVLLDLGLPDSHGLDTVARLQAHVPQLPIIVLTGLDDEAMGVKSLQSGAQDYLIKGQVNRDLLSRAIRYATERKKVENEIKELNKDLNHRAIALEAVNRELESFSYSVSHDLRAPLRRIDGFSLSLLEEYASKLEGRGKDFLRRIRGACQRMGELIDDLLNFSRVTRSEMRRGTVNLGAIARAVAGELRKAQPERDAEFVIAEDLPVDGDERLLRVVLENLLGNAWKFTGPCPQARIEFGITQKDGKRVYFVRDNGAGFDMAHADRLFGPFQRLHEETEFPGTGIGLATVQRIIHRHGGRVWAESEVSKGATFFFTLAA